MGVHTKGVHPVAEGPFLACLSYRMENRFTANSASSKLSRDFHLARQGGSFEQQSSPGGFEQRKSIFFNYFFFQRKRVTLLSSLGYIILISSGLR